MPGIVLGWPMRETRSAVGFMSEAGAPGAQATEDSRSKPLFDATEAHCLVVAPTGAGKGRGLVIPNLLSWPHSVIVVDVKGEAALATARYRRALGQRVVLLDPFQRVSDGSDGLNPLDWLGAEPDHVADNASTLSETLTGTEVSLRDPFWDHMANDVVAGLLAYSATSSLHWRRQISFGYDMLTGEDPAHAIATMLDKEPDMHPYAKRQLIGFLNHEAEKVRTSVRSTAQQHLRVFASPMVQKAVSKTTFDLEGLGRGDPISIYLVMPATRLQSHAALLRVWLSVLLGCIAERSSQPAGPTLLIVDELAQIGGIPTILQALTLLRGYGLRVMPIIQSLAQLRSMWPKDYQTIIDNCGTVVAFGQTRPTMANPMAELFGDISAATLMQMPAEQIAVNRGAGGTTIARRLDYLHDPLFAGRFDPNPFYGAQDAFAKA